MILWHSMREFWFINAKTSTGAYRFSAGAHVREVLRASHWKQQHHWHCPRKITHLKASILGLLGSGALLHRLLPQLRCAQRRPQLLQPVPTVRGTPVECTGCSGSSCK